MFWADSRRGMEAVIMHDSIVKGMMGIVLAAVLLFSELFSIRSEALSADSVSGNETGTEEEDMISPEEETEVESAAEEEAETKTETEINTEIEEETEEEPETETGEETEQESEGAEKEDGVKDAELSVSGNEAAEDITDTFIDVGENLADTWENDREENVEWIGHTIPTHMLAAYDQSDLGEEVPESCFYLEEKFQGHQSLPGMEDGQDWVYALCNALESSLNVKNCDEKVSIDRDALVSYLYSEDKSNVINKEYGDISKDIVIDPEKGNENAAKTGNVHTAMWAVASGYAVKNAEAPEQKYRLNHIYMYNMQERDKIKNAVETQGEVVTSIYRHDEFFYDSQEYSALENISLRYFCPKSKLSQTDKEHAVTIVGWDDNYPSRLFDPEENYLSDKQCGAWLVKDVYGYEGRDKYWVSYYDAAFYDAASEASGGKVNCYSFDFAKAGENTHIYQYDGGGSYYVNGQCASAKAVNIFPKAGLHEVLNAISFGTYTRNAQYEIQVYLEARPAGEENSQPILGKPLFENPVMTEKYSKRGYYTIDLEQYRDEYANEPRLSSLDEEAWFAVEITIVRADGQQGGELFWIDGINYPDYKPKCCPDGSASGQSYVWKDGKWLDFGQDIATWEGGKGSNIRIKAHTEDRLALEAFNGGQVCREVWVGETLELQASIGGKPIDEGENLEWFSDNPEIAEVSAEGTISPKAPGYVEISATSEKYGSDTIEIMVKDFSCTEHLLLCSNSVNMEKRKGQIICTFYPEEYEPHHIEYSVAQEDKAYLWIDDETGVVTVKEEAGTRENIPITVKIYTDKDNFIAKEMTVSCYQVPEKFAIVNEEQEAQDSVEIKIFEELQLGLRIMEPANAIAADIMWKSSSPAVVSVSSQGKLYAFKEGTAVITAFSKDDPDNQAQIKVTVKEGVSGISFSESYISLLPYESKQVVVKVLPDNTEHSEIKWSMTDLEGNDLGLRNRSVSFDPDTRTLTAGSGSMAVTKLKLYAECEGVRSSCFIKVDVPVRSLRLSFSDDSIVTEQIIKTSVQDQRLHPSKLYCHFKPETLSAEDVVLFYSTDDPQTAKVTKDGMIIPLKTGSVNFSAGTENGITSSKVHLTIQSLYTEQTLSLYSEENKIYAGGAETKTTLMTVITEDGKQAPAEDFYWEVSDEGVAVVDETGKVTAVSRGRVTVTATDKLNSMNKVRKELQVGVLASEIQTKRDDIEIVRGKTITLDYNVLPADADEKTVTLYAEDENIVWCYGKRIYALEEGTTSVYLETENGVRKEIAVRVREQGAARIEAGLVREDIETTYITTRGTRESQAQIKAAAYDEYGNTEEISQIFDFYSEDSDIAMVDDNGCVTGGNAGETRIRVSAADGSGLSTYVPVTVEKADSGIKSVTLNHSNIELEMGEKIELIAALLPENASGIQEVLWQSMDEAIATVNADGVVSTQGYGRTYIVAQSLDGKKSASCEIKVLPVDSQIKLLKIEDQVLENKLVNPASGYQISVYANDGKDYRAYCEFTSSDENVCTVDEKGMVVPSGRELTGTSTITVKVKNDLLGRKVSFKVKLTDEKQAADIRLYANLSAGKKEIGAKSPLYLPAEAGKEVGLESFVIDRGGNLMEESSLKWSTSDKKVLTVRELKDGKTNLIIKGTGSCTLTCSERSNSPISVSVPVYIYDGKPMLTINTLSVNLSKTERIFLPLQECAGTKIEELQIAYIKKGKKYPDGGFEIAEDGNASGQYVLNYDAEYLSKGNYVIYAKTVVRYDDSEEGRILKEIDHGQDKKIEILEIPVKVTDRQPKVKIKNPVLNVFEKNAKQKLEITAEEEIDRIELSDGKTDGIEEKFNIKREEDGFWIYALTEQKGSFHAVLNVYLKHYAEPVSVKCTIKTVINKPKLKAAPEKLFVYKRKDETADFSFRIYDSAGKEYISQEAGYEIEGGSLEKDWVRISGLDSFGKKTIQVLVKNEKLWNDDILLKVPVTVEDESKITLEASQDKITLNKRLNQDCAKVSVFMKQQNIQISSIEAVDIYNAKNKPSKNFDVTWKATEAGEQVIEFRAEKSCEKGKYKAEITVKAVRQASDGSTDIKTYTKTVTLTVEDVLPAVKVKLKGSIDLYHRAETCMTGVVTVSHTADRIVDITSEREDFTVIYDREQEQFMLSLRQNQRITKKKQTVILKIKLSGGTELRKAVSVNLRQSGIKWKEQDTAVVCKSVGNRTAVIPFEAQIPEDADVKITVLSLPKGMSADTKNRQISVSVEDESIKPGKYKIKTAVRLLDFDGLTPMDSAAVRKEVVIQVK